MNDPQPARIHVHSAHILKAAPARNKPIAQDDIGMTVAARIQAPFLVSSLVSCGAAQHRTPLHENTLGMHHYEQ